MLVRCPVCGSRHRVVGFEGDERVVNYYCRPCERIVKIDLELDEVPSSSSSGSFRKIERRRSVVVADDDERTLEQACRMLREAGYLVRKAHDGAEALEMIRDSHPDLVVLDTLMPRMSGLDVIRELRRDERLRQIPVLAVSGLMPQDPETFLRRRGVRGFLRREELRHRLVREVRNLLGDEPKPPRSPD